jgi:hypothetical protein
MMHRTNAVECDLQSSAACSSFGHTHPNTRGIWIVWHDHDHDHDHDAVLNLACPPTPCAAPLLSHKPAALASDWFLLNMIATTVAACEVLEPGRPQPLQ